ncbi:hypothetical protein FS837_002858 [Tulasnella sp. UAMH 9824]|nr:hypothetical protein FS837_002858 [Tulasnella sp. UAMH 9824]
MFGKIFRPRRSTATPSLPFQIGPTTAQPATTKSPSKLLKKIKQLNKVIRSNSLTKKFYVHLSKYPLAPKTLVVLPPTAVTGLDYPYQRVSPTRRHRIFRTIIPSTGDSPRTAAPTANAPPSNFPINYTSALLAPVDHTSPGHQQPAPISYVGAEGLAAKRLLAELEAIDRDSCRDGAQEIKLRLSKQPQRVVIHTSPAIQSYSAQGYPCQPAEGLLAPPANALPKIETTEGKEQNNRCNHREGLQQGKQYCTSGAMDWKERVARYRNGDIPNHVQPDTTRPALARPGTLNLFTNTLCSSRVKENVYPLSEQACGLRRNGGIQRKEQPYQHLKGSTFASVAQGPNQPVRRSNDEGSPLQDSVAHTARRTLREPLERPNRNAGLDETCQASADEDSEDANSSYDYPSRASALEPSLWLGQGLL